MTLSLPPVVAALRGRRHAVVEASAGTGKTFTLEHLVVDLVARGTPIDRVLVVTFTEKAATELRVRVRALLDKAIAAGGVEDGNAPELQEENRSLERLRAARGAFELATIGTIHSYCQRALREVAFEAGRPFEQTLTTTAPLLADAFRALFRTSFAADPALSAAFVDCPPNAFAATLAKVLAAGHPLAPSPEEIALATAAVHDPRLLARARKDLASGGSRARKQPTRAAALAVVELLERGDLGAAALALTGLKNAPRELFVEVAPSLYDALVLAAAGVAPLSRALVAAAPPLAAAVRARKEAEGLVDFDDLVRLLAELLAAGTEASAAAATTLRARHDVALLDEFQDTDEHQWAIFRALFLREDKRLLLVGDPKQAIYRFRGGDLPTYLSAVSEVLAAGGGDVVPLTENFRSSPALIDATNRVLAADFFHGRNRYPHPVTAGRKDRRLVDREEVPLPPLVLALSEEDDATPEGAVDALVATIAETVAEGFIEDAALGLRPLRWSDVFVLVQRRADGDEIARALRRARIPAARYKEEGLFQTAEAAAVFDLLDTLVHPADRSREVRAYLTCFFGAAPEDLEALAALADEHPLRRLREDLLALARRGLGPLLAELLPRTAARRRLLVDRDGPRRVTNLEHVLELLGLAAKTADVEGALRLLGAWIDGVEQPPGGRALVLRRAEQGDAVQILTMHASKGLEAPVVALVSLRKKAPKIENFPVFRGKTGRRVWVGDVLPRDIAEALDREAAEEAERVAYVALTRASHRTILAVRREEGALVPAAPMAAPFTTPALRAFAAGAPGITLFRPRARRPLAARAAPAPAIVAPPEALPAPPEAPLDVAALLRAAAPRRAYSFTSLAAATGAGAPLVAPLALDGDDAFGPLRGDVDAPTAREDAPPPATFLDGAEEPARPARVPFAGARFGDFVHQFIEAVALAPTPPGDDATLLPLGAPLAAAAGYGEDALAAALPLVRAALTAPLPAPSGPFSLRAALDARPRRVLPELEFQLALAGTRDRLLGSIDVALSHEGRVHLIDWKTNLLEAYDEAALAADVAAHYALQVAVYTVAAARHFALEGEAFDRGFGGVHYVYVRGVAAGLGGVYSAHPTAADLARYRVEVAARVDRARALLGGRS